jgi:aromatic-L-amino-acid decarboxylase
VRNWQNLDPADWGDFRKLGHQMIDDIADILAGLRDRAAWRPVPAAAEQYFSSGLPLLPSDAEAVYREIREHVLDYPSGNIHPRFFGWVLGSNAPIAILGSLLEAGIDSAPTLFDDSASRVEAQLIEWLKQALRYPAAQSGLITSGCSEAHLIALAAARYAAFGSETRAEGNRGQPVRVYGSDQTHSSIKKALDILGFGQNAFVEIGSNAAQEIDVDKLEARMTSDMRLGYRPLAVIGNVGTTNTGAIDPLVAMAQVARRHGAWFHVDGAFGAWLRLLPEYEAQTAGFEAADSVATDLHKWMYQPYDIGLVLIRDAKSHGGALGMEPDYLMRLHGGALAGTRDYCGLGIQMSRSFRALKAWLSLKVHGLQVFETAIRANVLQAKRFSQGLERTGNIQLLAPVASNVVAFRCSWENATEEETDAANECILLSIQRSGIAVPSPTRFHGRFAIRAAFCNHRTTDQDVDAFLAALTAARSEARP